MGRIFQNLSNPVTLIMIISFLITLSLIPFCIFISRKLNLLDIPEERKMHKKPVPKSGGIAIIISYFLILSYSTNFNLYFFGTAISLSLLIILDDLYQLNRYFRLASQFLILLPFALNIFNFDTTLISKIILAAILFLFCSFINLFNFFDGLNILLSSQFLISLLFYLINYEILGLRENINDFRILIGSIIAFLLFNSFGLIFMGDVGSCFLGLFAATLFIKSAIIGNISTTILIMAPLLPILSDTSLTLLIRMKNGEKFFSTPHKQHAYQLLARMGLNHLSVSSFYALKQIIYTTFVFFVYQSNNKVSALLGSIFIVVFLELILMYKIRTKAMKKRII